MLGLKSTPLHVCTQQLVLGLSAEGTWSLLLVFTVWYGGDGVKHHQPFPLFLTG
jgi:hypothetical protein